MKKLVVLMLVAILAIGLFGCTGDVSSSDKELKDSNEASAEGEAFTARLEDLPDATIESLSRSANYKEILETSFEFIQIWGNRDYEEASKLEGITELTVDPEWSEEEAIELLEESEYRGRFVSATLVKLGVSNREGYKQSTEVVFEVTAEALNAADDSELGENVSTYTLLFNKVEEEGWKVSTWIVE